MPTDAGKLERLKKDLEFLKAKGFEREIESIRGMLSNPSLIPEAESQIKALKAKLRERLFEAQIAKEFDKAEIVQKAQAQPQAQAAPAAQPEHELSVDEIFVIYKGGILLSHQTRRLKPFSDNEIVAGMLTAVLNYVQDFVRDTFSQKSAPIRRIEYGDYKIIIETGEHVCIAAVLGGDEPKNTSALMVEMIDKIEDRYKEFFENWDGDVHKIKEIDGYVGDLVRALSGGDAKPGRRADGPRPIKVVRQEAPRRDEQHAAPSPQPSVSYHAPSSQSQGGVVVQAPSPDDKIELKKSFCYLIKEERPNKAYLYFNNALKSGTRGICISRDPPQKVKVKYNLPDIPVIWLSNTPSEHSMAPKNLEKIAFALFDFMAKDEGSLILLDCMEYLITNNNFTTILKFVQSLKDKVTLNKSILMVPINPAALESQQINLLETEMDVVI